MQASQVRSILSKMPTLSLVRPAKVTAPASRTKSRGIQSRRVKALAEAVILQAVEDLWSDTQRQRSREFFTGGAFGLFADIADMGAIERVRLLKMIGKAQRGKSAPLRKFKRAVAF